MRLQTISLNLDFSPASPDQVAFNAALAVIDGVEQQKFSALLKMLRAGLT
jgi:hypothetical protein